MSLLHHDARREPLAQLSCFRGEFYACLTARSDALFEPTDAVLCGDGPVRPLAEPSLAGEHRRGRGGLCAAVARGRIGAGRLRREHPGTAASSSSGSPTPGPPDTETDTGTRLHGTAGARSLEPAAPQAGPPLFLGSRRRHPPGRRRDGDPPGHRPPAQRSSTEAGLVAVAGHRCHPGGRRPSLAGIPATLGHRAHLLPVQTDPRLTSPEIRAPETAGRWAWLILAAYTQLRPARPLAADRRRPREKPGSRDRLTPVRVRRGFRPIRPQAVCPARAPKPCRPGPGRPPG